MRGRKNPSDKIFLWTVGVLVATGALILTSASIGLFTRNGADFFDVLKRQFILGLGAGAILFAITSRINYKKWQFFSFPFFAASFLLTLFVFVPGLGKSYGGAARWLDLRIISFQPSELLKFAFAVYLSSWIVARKNDVSSYKFGFIPFLFIVGLVGLVLIYQPDIGTLGVIAITALALFFLGGGKVAQIVLCVILGLSLLAILIFFEPYRMERLTVFLRPSVDQSGIGYHLKQSLISFGSGDIFGRGFGMSLQKFQYLPEPISDSIFAVFGEEFGFAGVVFLISVFLFFLYRGFYIAVRAPDDFGRLMGAGIVILIITQSFINIAAMIGLVPLTGVPLVFVSKGGTSLAITLAEIGVLANISKYA